MTRTPHAGDDTADREIVISRLLDAPREKVFQVWTTPDHVAKWWGPSVFTNTILVMDVRPGGIWRFIMHGPDGVDYPNRIDFIEVVPLERLVYSHRDDGGADTVHFHVTVTFEDEGGQTRLTMRSLFDTAAERNRVVDEYGAIEGGRQMLERLVEFLKTV